MNIRKEEFAYLRKTSYTGLHLVSSWNSVEAGLRNFLGYLGEPSREPGCCVVGFYCYPYSRFLPLCGFVDLLSLEGTKSIIAYSIQTQQPTMFQDKTQGNIELIEDKVSYPPYMFCAFLVRGAGFTHKFTSKIQSLEKSRISIKHY